MNNINSKIKIYKLIIPSIHGLKYPDNYINITHSTDSQKPLNNKDFLLIQNKIFELHGQEWRKLC
jgi:hypothetical protein